MMSLYGRSSSRTVPLLIMISLLTALGPGSAAGDASSSVTGSVQLVNEGTLAVDWGEGDIVFRTVSGGAAGVSSINGDVMHAQVPITVADSRANGARGPYSIMLSMGDQSSGQNIMFSSNIFAVGVTGLPDSGLSQGFSGRTPFASPVTVVRSSSQPPSGTFTFLVNVQMRVPAGTVPGDYSGTVSLEIELD